MAKMRVHGLSRIYVLEAIKDGIRERHSYTLSAFKSKDVAIKHAMNHCADRDGKYSVAVHELIVGRAYEGLEFTEVYRVKGRNDNPEYLREWCMKNAADTSFVSLEHLRMNWSLRTFPEATALSSLNKCRTELDEIEKDLSNGERKAEEYVDAMMCILDSAGRNSISVTELIESFRIKLAINMRRKWKKNPDNSYSHI